MKLHFRLLKIVLHIFLIKIVLFSLLWLNSIYLKSILMWHGIRSHQHFGPIHFSHCPHSFTNTLSFCSDRDILLILIFLFRMTLLNFFSVPKLIKSLFLTESELYLYVSSVLSVLCGTHSSKYFCYLAGRQPFPFLTTRA